MMVGREIVFRVQKKEAVPGKTILEVENLTVKNKLGIPLLKDVSFNLRAGEILGIAGVSGNGQEALVSSLTGLGPAASGSIRLLGEDISTADVRTRRQRLMAHVPEDRIKMGLNIDASVAENAIMGFQWKKEFLKGPLLNNAVSSEFAKKIIAAYSVYGAAVDSPVSMLSGGNMQKIVLGREAASEPVLLIVNQPTRGLDVGSIEFVHQMLIDKRDRGMAILLVSVELEEIISLSDRVEVLYRGAFQGEFSGEAINENNIGLLMAVGKKSET